MDNSIQEKSDGLLFTKASEIYVARQRLSPKSGELRKMLVDPFLFSQPLYGYEQAVFDIWAGLKERQLTGNKQFSAEDLEALKTILSWIDGLTREEIEAEKIQGRDIPPLFLGDQTKGTIKERLENLTAENSKGDSFFGGLLTFLPF